MPPRENPVAADILPAPGGAGAPKKGRRAKAPAPELPIAEIEGRIGHRFADPSLLVQALTHRSFSQESIPPGPDNQRLEFLGDAVLQLIVTERLWRGHGEADEGDLTRMRSERVSGQALARAARRLGIADYLRLGRGEEKTGGRGKASIMADAFEALVGALYLDAGYPACVRWVEDRLWEASPEEANGDGLDYKSQLQEALQRHSRRLPLYTVIRESGPEHLKVFEVEVRHDGRVLGQGTGTTKKAAEQAAARESLRALEGGSGDPA
ncbi:MAG: ribonuclease III [Candidatus Tectomicrobia bacterium]|uniref:Ribonuclease 3 n=1 Tax=Tectimicrobiota bacterium TaxID=2528274 RepID=A0A932I108_UNCTE|nr:ribonuclease III [Candidatus Tectomicrobia bacterium]